MKRHHELSLRPSAMDRKTSTPKLVKGGLVQVSLSEYQPFSEKFLCFVLLLRYAVPYPLAIQYLAVRMASSIRWSSWCFKDIWWWDTNIAASESDNPEIKLFSVHFARLYFIKSSTNTPQYSSLVNNGSRCFQRVVLWHWYCLRYAQNFFSIWSLVHRFDNKFLGFFKYLQVVPNSTIMQSSIFRATIFFVMF